MHLLFSFRYRVPLLTMHNVHFSTNRYWDRRWMLIVQLWTFFYFFLQRIKCTQVLLSANHRIVPTFNLVLLHVPAVLIAGTTAIATTEVSFPSVDEHVSHQIPLELGNLSTDLASVLLLSATAQRKENLLNVFRFTGSERSGGFSWKWQWWRRRKSSWAKALHHLWEGKC